MADATTKILKPVCDQEDLGPKTLHIYQVSSQLVSTTLVVGICTMREGGVTSRCNQLDSG